MKKCDGSSKRIKSSLSSSSSYDSSEDNSDTYYHTKPLLYKLGILGFAILQNGLLQGLIYGWASIDQTLLVASYKDGGTQLNKHETFVLFTISSCLAMISPLLLGFVLDYYGPKKCSLVSCCIVAIGCYIVSMTGAGGGDDDDEHDDGDGDGLSSSLSSSNSDTNSDSSSHYCSFLLFIVGFGCIGFGGPGIMSSIVHISNLFINYENFIMSILSGSTALSFSIFTLFDYLYEHYAIGYKTLFGYYVYVATIMGILSYFLYPNEPYEKYDPELDDNDNDEDDENDEDYKEKGEEGGRDDEHRPLIVESTVTEEVQTSKAEQPTIDLNKLRHEEYQDGQHHIDHDDHHEHHPHLQHHHHHHHHHIIHPFHASTISKRPTITVEQSFTSYLRSDSNFKMIHRTESFKQSQWAYTKGYTQLMSLKDQPFMVQLCSGIYLRALLVFISTSYWANVYVLSLSTEVRKNDSILCVSLELLRGGGALFSLGFLLSFIQECDTH